MGRSEPDHGQTAEAWDIVAASKYRSEFDDHVAMLRAGEDNLLPEERALLGDLVSGADVVQLQCSHGLDALGLLNAGARSVVGIDISSEMIAQAKAKAEATGATEATFLVADAVQPPHSIRGTADLVYTGRGSLPWILDLEAWADAVASLLRPQGHVFVFEGHPLTSLWRRDTSDLELRPGVSYFDRTAQEQPGFPASVADRTVGSDRPAMLERQWQPGEVIESLLVAGLRLRQFRELPTLFWDQFPSWPEDLRTRIPNSYAVMAQAR